jgi:pyruvate/2-oxoglutarate dehydrogenase complex dihydrolipoamide acyltransferase (E2) component
MPALSPTMETGKIQKWNYKVGDEVVVGDALADIETDKSTMAYEMIDDGFIAKLLFEAGDADVPVGQVKIFGFSLKGNCYYCGRQRRYCQIREL